VAVTAGTGLAVERRGPVGWLIFDRPQAANAMDAAMFDGLPGAWRELDGDPDVRAIVVTGRGRAFQTGLDMAALAREPATLREATRRTRDGDPRLTGWHLGLSTPVIAAVNGVCAGGGLHFVVDADIVIASTAASFLDPHVSVGQASAWEAVGLSRRIPAAVAARMMLVGSGERLDAARALQIGLVSEVVEPSGLEAAAQRIGERIAGADPRITRARKRALWAGAETGLTAALRLTAASAQDITDTTGGKPSDAAGSPERGQR
jgi:enoyl-CoA hydratase/carnithine racemase